MTLDEGWLVEQLPRTMADDDFTRRFATIFEDVAGTVRSRIDEVPTIFDVGLGPLEFVRWMASWVGQSIDPSVPEDRQRSLAVRIGPLFPKRGTAQGIKEMLEALTQADVQVSDSGGIYTEGSAPDATPHVEVRVSETGELQAQQLLRIVESEVPADTTVELIIGTETIETEHDTEELEAMVTEMIPDQTLEPGEDPAVESPDQATPNAGSGEPPEPVAESSSDDEQAEPAEDEPADDEPAEE